MKLNLFSEILVCSMIFISLTREENVLSLFFSSPSFFLFILFMSRIFCIPSLQGIDHLPAWLHESISVVVHDHALTSPASTRISVVGASHRCCMRLKFRVMKKHAKLPFWMCPMNWISCLWLQNCQFGFDRKSL